MAPVAAALAAVFLFGSAFSRHGTCPGKLEAGEWVPPGTASQTSQWVCP